MPPFRLWDGRLTREAWKALVLQLDPSDDEAEQKIRMALERRTTDDLETGLRMWLKDAIPNASSVELDAIEQRLESGRWRIRDVLRRALQDSADLGVSVAVDQFENIGFGFDWTLANQSAAEWVESYTFDLVTGITDTTMERLQIAIPEWINNGDPLQSLYDDLTPMFGRSRAELIASTEVTRAYAEGNAQAYRASGVVRAMEWRTANDEKVCPECGPLGGLHNDGGGQSPKPLGHQIGAVSELSNPKFTHPVTGKVYGLPPAHPRCRCWVVPVIEEAN